MKKQRILIKLSGGQLAGDKEWGIDPKFIDWLADEIKTIANDTEIAIVVGGGNFIRGAKFNSDTIDRTTADQMGMLSTIINGLALSDSLEHHGLPTRLQTAIQMNQITEQFIRRKALRHLEKGRIVIVGGGTGKPFVTTDSAATTTALELNCDQVIKATDVDGVYDKDPNQHDDAKLFKEIDFQTVMENPDIKVMDKSALGLAMEQGMPIRVFNINKSGNLRKIIDGEAVGTLVK